MSSPTSTIPSAPPSPSPSSLHLPHSPAGTRRAALAHIIAALEVDWVRDYLLCIEGATEAAILASPLQQLHSICWISDASHSSVGHRDSSAELAFHSTNITVPAFSCAGHTAGAIIEDVSGHWDPDNKFLERGYRYSRYIMSETTGAYVGMCTSNVANRTLLFSIQQCNTRVNVMQCFVFNAAQLRNLIGHTKSIPAFENALEQTMALEQTRSCPICGAPGTFECTCRLEYRQARNSLDFGAITSNMTSQLGSYQGFGFQEHFLNGRPFKTVHLGTNWKGIHIAKHGSSRRLLTWAISNSLRTQAPKVDRYLPLYDIEEKPQFIASEPNEARIGSMDEDIACLNVSEISPSSVNLDAIDMSMGSFDFFDFPGQVGKPVSSIKAKDHKVPQVTFDELAKPWESLSSLPTERPPDSHAVALVPETPVPTSIPALVQMPANRDVTSEAVSTSRKPCSKAVPIAPLVVQKESSEDGVKSEEEVRKNAMELRQLRAYQRKIRNRESAARSNLARKKRKEMQRLELAKKQDSPQSGVGSAVS